MVCFFFSPAEPAPLFDGLISAVPPSPVGPGGETRPEFLMQKNKQGKKKNQPTPNLCGFVIIFFGFFQAFRACQEEEPSGWLFPKRKGKGYWGGGSLGCAGVWGGGGGKGGTGKMKGGRSGGGSGGVCSLWLPARPSRRLRNVQLKPTTTISPHPPRELRVTHIPPPPPPFLRLPSSRPQNLSATARCLPLLAPGLGGDTSALPWDPPGGSEWVPEVPRGLSGGGGWGGSLAVGWSAVPWGSWYWQSSADPVSPCRSHHGQARR